jgi:hypothetical protein
MDLILISQGEELLEKNFSFNHVKRTALPKVAVFNNSLSAYFHYLIKEIALTSSS